MSAARCRKPGVPSRRVSSKHSPRRKVESGQRAGREDLELQSYEVGAVPLLNALLERMRLAEILTEHLPPDDPRTELPTVCGLLVLLRNVLIGASQSTAWPSGRPVSHPTCSTCGTMKWRSCTTTGWGGAWIGCSPAPGPR